MALEANQPIQIVLSNRSVHSRVIRVMSNELYIDALRDAEMELTPMPGQKIPLRWSEDETLYQQFGRVTDILDPIPIIVLLLEGSPRVVEFRKSFRVRVALPLEYSLVRPDSEWLLTTTLDVSSTGLRFPSAVKLWVGLELRMRIRVEQRVLELVGKVVRVAAKPREVRGRESWETAVTFTAVQAASRRWLDQYVRRQHARRQLGSFIKGGDGK